MNALCIVAMATVCGADLCGIGCVVEGCEFLCGRARY